jgi:hypothetical protein
MLLNKFKALAIAAPLAASLALPLAGVAHADDRDFTVVNNSTVGITELYVSPSSSSDWGNNLLDGLVIVPGGQVPVHFTGGGDCIWDIHEVEEDGRTVQGLGLDLCSISALVSDDNGVAVG